jgi:ribosomal protein S18 acetylase RimI-like enzyme
MNANRPIASSNVTLAPSIVSRNATELMASAKNIDAESLISHALPWVIAAGRDYYYWLCGGKEAAERAVAMWMRREDSEASIRRVQFFLCDSKIAAGSIELTGADLKLARAADIDSLWQTLDIPGRGTLIERLTESAKLFAPVAEDEYYGSKMAVDHSFRGQNIPAEMMQQYLGRGTALGFTKFRLDVHVANQHAIRWYQAFGFEIFYTGQSTDRALRYHGMRLERKGK